MSLIQISGSQMQVYREETINATKHIIMQKEKWIMIHLFIKGIIIIKYWSIYTCLIYYF